MAAVPVKAPRDALTGKAAFQAAGYRRRGSRRSERGGATGAESAANRSHRGGPRRKRATKSHAWDNMCPTRGAICVPRVGQAWFHAWDRSSPSDEAAHQTRRGGCMAASLNANCRLTQESQNCIARIISHTESQRNRESYRGNCKTTEYTEHTERYPPVSFALPCIPWFNKKLCQRFCNWLYRYNHLKLNLRFTQVVITHQKHKA